MRHGRNAVAIRNRRTTYLHPQREFVSTGPHCTTVDVSDLILRCIYSIFLMHRREDLWGPDGQFELGFVRRELLSETFFAALVFDPDRFLDERLRKYLLSNPFIFLPFNAGPRICLGQQVIPVDDPGCVDAEGL